MALNEPHWKNGYYIERAVITISLTEYHGSDWNAEANEKIDEHSPSTFSPANRNRASACDLIQATVDDKGSGEDPVRCDKLHTSDWKTS